MSMLAELAPGLSGLEQLRALLELGLQPPMGKTLGISLVAIEEGFAAFEGNPSEQFYNPIGTVHGGYAATILDSACGCAVHSKLAPAQRFTTLDLKVAFHRALTKETGTVRAEGRLPSFGRRAAFAEAKLVDNSRRLLASATSSLLIISA